jgi:hypothetical protein
MSSLREDFQKLDREQKVRAIYIRERMKELRKEMNTLKAEADAMRVDAEAEI